VIIDMEVSAMILTLTGPSGVGKGYISRGIHTMFPSLKQLVWVTTRSLRQGEETSLNRRHVSPGEFAELVANGNAVLPRNLYDIRYAMIVPKGGFNEGIWLTELSTDNVVSAIDLGYEIYPIALIPSDLDFLRTRLERYRGTDNQEEVEKRLMLARKEIDWIAEHLFLFVQLIEISQANEQRVLSEVGEIVRGILKEAS
jgi:guanylate kinase